MQFMDIKRPIVCGHSFGSSVAFNVAEKYPNFIEGYINLAGITNYWSFGMTIVYKSVVA
jgi:pimeloyl-ACP methyl ester carboxylesterase